MTERVYNNVRGTLKGQVTLEGSFVIPAAQGDTPNTAYVKGQGFTVLPGPSGSNGHYLIDIDDDELVDIISAKGNACSTLGDLSKASVDNFINDGQVVGLFMSAPQKHAHILIIDPTTQAGAHLPGDWCSFSITYTTEHN